jgi:hypothetical protein
LKAVPNAYLLQIDPFVHILRQIPGKAKIRQKQNHKEFHPQKRVRRKKAGGTEKPIELTGGRRGDRKKQDLCFPKNSSSRLSAVR